MKKIGILGGTFDPIHNGHLNLAMDALVENNLDFVFIMPARRSPFKRDKKIASSEDRINMIKEAIKDREFLCLIESEINGDEISYTFDTMERLKIDFNDCQFYLILGTDSIISLVNWYKGEELLLKYSFIVGARPGYKDKVLHKTIEEYQKKYNASIQVLNSPMLDISATTIREHIKNDEGIGDLVPLSVERYIYDNGVY